MNSRSDLRPLIAHVMYRFDVGGLENGVANLINGMAADAYRHAVISLTEVTDFRQRIHRDDVLFHALGKPPGHAVKLYPELYRLFRELRPAIVHSRNLAALEVAIPAWASGVPVRLHGEHGWDIGDLHGTSRKYRWVRRFYRPFVNHYVALSGELARYLTGRIGVPRSRVSHLCNGVDSRRFQPPPQRMAIPGCLFTDPGLWVIGSVGRMQAVKDQTNLARAFVIALASRPDLRQRLRLVMVGDGPLRQAAADILDSAGVGALAWLPGERSDIPEILRGLDCFVLPSLAEGISNTILEAMATGLPVIATNVGGNGELVQAGITGELVPAADPSALAERILAYAEYPERAREAGRAARLAVERNFSLEAMVESYRELYDRVLFEAGVFALA